MVTRSLAEATAAMGGALVAGDPDATFSGAVLDSRKIVGGELFFAMRGATADGHDFVAGALGRGAAAAVVDHPVAASGAQIRVPVVYDALHALTRAVRRQVPRQGLVGITGSTGKTTTKELVAAVLAGRYEVAKSPGNLNNLLGFPLALLGTAESCEWLVAELGMSTPGELAQISALARPDVVVYTNVRAVHLEFFASVSAIAEAKAELLDGLVPGGTIVANADDPEVMRIVTRHRRERDPSCRIVRYGLDGDAEVTATAIEALAGGLGSRFTLVFRDAPGPTVELPLLGRHNVENALAAAAVALALGVAPAAIAAALATAKPAPMRGEVLRLAHDVTVVDDSYNSNPAALDRALDAAAAIPASRHWAVIGDMRELGPTAPAFHRAAGGAAARRGFGPLVAVGAHAADVLAGAHEVAPHVAAHAFDTAADAAAAMPTLLLPGDLVLVKGSRGVGLERVVTALRTAAASCEAAG